MNKMKKIGALLLAVMMIAVVGLAFADTTIGTGTGTTSGTGANGAGEIGGYVEADKQATGIDKVIRIEKDIVAYNPDETYVFGPEIEYEYTITAGSADVSITDATTDHASGVSSVASTLAGVVTGVSVDNASSGEPNKGSVRWANTDILEASPSGVANKKYLRISFENVVFTRPGVYRYVITETEKTDTQYKAAGVTETTGTHVRYLDVYVMRSSTFNAAHDGSTEHPFAASDWAIYGYVCVYNNDKAIVDGDTNHAVKTNGFVDGTSNGTTTIAADKYYTYNITITKDLTGDNQMIDHQFPFEVSFNTTANSVGGKFQLIAETDGNKSALVTTSSSVEAGTSTVNSSNPGTTEAITKFGNAQVLSASNYNVKIADGNTTADKSVGKVKIIGIPYDVTASVKETNDNIGTTYTTTVKEDDTTDAGTTLVAVDMTSTSGTEATLNGKKGASIDYNETATRTAAVANHNVAIQFINNLAIISPTGYVSRFAPYALILIAGIVLLIVAKKRKPAEEE